MSTDFCFRTLCAELLNRYDMEWRAREQIKAALAQTEGISLLNAKAWSYIGRQAMCGDSDAQALVDATHQPRAVEPAPASEAALNHPESSPAAEIKSYLVQRMGDGSLTFPAWAKALEEFRDRSPVSEPTTPSASAGQLVERVGEAMERHHIMGDIEGSWDAQARAAIREIAAALRDPANPVKNAPTFAYWLEREADRG